MTVPSKITFTVGGDDVGRRLDQVLAARVEGLSRRQARVLLDIGGVFVDGRRVKVAGRPMHAGDDDVVVVEKPAGLLTAPTPESDRNNLADLLKRRPGGAPVLVVHRIDLDTSGLIVFAKSEHANRELSRRFRDHDLERAYLAVVAGSFPADLKTIDRPVGGRRAVTHVEIRERFDDRATMLTCRLETGRTHQIRLHMAAVGTPVIGDARYGRPFWHDRC
jgi:23S rRNA pseudouridine1911/1915/1917 synthase